MIILVKSTLKKEKIKMFGCTFTNSLIESQDQLIVDPQIVIENFEPFKFIANFCHCSQKHIKFTN